MSASPTRGGFPYRFSRAKFEIPSYFAPLELDFVVVQTDPETGEETFDGPRGRRQWPAGAFAVPIGMAAGSPAPLGASRAAPEVGLARLTSFCSQLMAAS